ncbi:LysR family transcriptional regulator [Kitasatospora sp. NPDC087314]|uniref:helix-turn-helix domain-containing protein n=1 Tax=Kitasatospora sp. NPDC087314 TaxID=3364068 RepID=UPI00380FC5B4
MNPSRWQDRVQQEDELLQQLRTKMSHAGQRRAEALYQGVAELGSVEAVAAELGISRPAVSKAMRKNRPAATGHTTTP